MLHFSFKDRSPLWIDNIHSLGHKNEIKLADALDTKMITISRNNCFSQLSCKTGIICACPLKHRIYDQFLNKNDNLLISKQLLNQFQIIYFPNT